MLIQEKKSADDKIAMKIRDYADLNADTVVLGAFGAKTEEMSKESVALGTVGAAVQSYWG